jgi:methenyltetrahydromethanopterin cyclohydrolase
MLALQDETKAKTIPIKVGGRVIDFPAARDWTWEATERLAQNDMGGLFAEIGLSDEDVDHLRTLPTKHLAGILAHLQQVSGVDPEDFLVSGKPSATRPRRRR